MKTARQLKDFLDKLTADNEKRINALRDELKRTEEQHIDTMDVKRRLDDALSVARVTEGLAERNYTAQLQRETAQQQAINEKEKIQAAEIDSRNKETARAGYLAAGGNPEAFEQTWETALRPKFIEEKVVAKVLSPQPARTKIAEGSF